MLERYREIELPRKQDGRNYSRHIVSWIKNVGVYKISALSRSKIVEIRDRMSLTRAPATVNRYLATLRHAYNLAVTDWEWANKTPMARIMLREPRGRDRHLDDDEIAALLDAARNNQHPHLYPMVLLALTTGARRGEITSLKSSNLDLKSRRAVLRDTKNSDKRTLALIPKVVEELKKLKKVRRIDSGLVFENPNFGRRTYQSIESAWRTARARANLEDFRFHDLRYTFASRMAMDGRSLAEIAAALWHRTLAMVQRYAHLTDAHVHAAIEQTATKVLGDG